MYCETATRSGYFALLASRSTSKSNKDDEVSFNEKVEKVCSEFGLGEMGKIVVHKWLKQMAVDVAGLEHIRQYFLVLLNETQAKTRLKYADPWQLGCGDYIPGLKALPFWSKEEFSIDVESFFPIVKEEFEKARSVPVFQPYRAPNWVSPDNMAQDQVGSLATKHGAWDVCYLFLHNVQFKENQGLFKQTIEAMRSFKNRFYPHAFVSVLKPNTHITKHHGPTNKKLRIHLPLVVPPGNTSGLRVGGEERVFNVGECLVFDDSFEHEAWNHHPTEPRVCLIFDVWHPELSDREITFLKFLEKGKLNLARKVCANIGDTGSNFYSLLEHTKTLAKTV